MTRNHFRSPSLFVVLSQPSRHTYMHRRPLLFSNMSPAHTALWTLVRGVPMLQKERNVFSDHVVAPYVTLGWHCMGCHIMQPAPSAAYADPPTCVTKRCLPQPQPGNRRCPRASTHTTGLFPRFGTPSGDTNHPVRAYALPFSACHRSRPCVQPYLPCPHGVHVGIG